jgi:hypothetical protein
MARQPSGPPPHGKLRSRGTQTCEHVPTMLAARANGALGDADLDRLARHLERCERCDALGEIFRRAEIAYQDPAVDTLGTDTTSVLMDALIAVPEHGHAVAPAPAEGAVVGEALTGAFPTLPDVDDEVPVVEVEQVAEPAVELEPEAIAAEPLPETEPGELAPGDEDLGLTMEWDGEMPEEAPVTGEDGADGDAAPAPVLTGGKVRRSGPRPLAILLPLLLVAVLAAGAAAVAGVFSGDDGSPAVDKPPAPRVEAPVTTPLPIKVKAKTKPAASASASTDAPATSEDGTDAGGTSTAP